MVLSGTRHPFLFDYKLAVDDEGHFLDFHVAAYNNAGYLIELSKGVLGQPATRPQTAECKLFAAFRTLHGAS